MKKNATFAALAALAVLSLTGCAQSTQEAGAPSPATANPVLVTAAQEQALRGELRAIETSLDNAHVLPNVMMTCKTFLRDVPDRVQREQVEKIFFQDGDPTAAVPEGAADRIIAVIKTKALCQT